MLSGASVATSCEGSQQFKQYQSHGKAPNSPCEYYLQLTRGKAIFDFLCSEYLRMYRAGEWWGFYQLWLDWEGSRWLLPLLCKWYVKETGMQLPTWLDLEIDEKCLQKSL